MFIRERSARTVSRDNRGRSLGQRIPSARSTQLVASQRRVKASVDADLENKKAAEQRIAAEIVAKAEVVGQREGMRVAGGEEYQGEYNSRRGPPQRADGAYAKKTLDEESDHLNTTRLAMQSVRRLTEDDHKASKETAAAVPKYKLVKKNTSNKGVSTTIIRWYIVGQIILFFAFVHVFRRFRATGPFFGLNVEQHYAVCT